MIEWKKYDLERNNIVSNVNYIVTNGAVSRVAQYVLLPEIKKYCWVDGISVLAWVTHYAEINLPKSDS